MVAVAVAGEASRGGPQVITYDGRSLIIDGHRKILFSGSIHYPRSTPQVFTDLSQLLPSEKKEKKSLLAATSRWFHSTDSI